MVVSLKGRNVSDCPFLKTSHDIEQENPSLPLSSSPPFKPTGDDGENAGLVGLYAGELGENAGLDGLYAGEEGE